MWFAVLTHLENFCQKQKGHCSYKIDTKSKISPDKEMILAKLSSGREGDSCDNPGEKFSE